VWWVLASLVVVGALLRLWGLGAHRLGFDEAFTAMAGRHPLGDLFAYLRVRDSHPPLDYLIHAPLARAGVDEFLFRLPSVVCSIGAVALFAWWMRRRGLAGIVATALLAVSAFQLAHGREARMYADMELIGVATAVLAEAWLRRPRRWHAPAIGALVLVGLLTHVSMFLLGAGLLVVAGRRTDRAAWQWRIALAAGVAGWGVLWGPSFLEQTRGGHSNWIPRTTLAGMIHTFGRLVTYQSGLHLFAVVAVAAGAFLLARADRRLARVWVCCVLVPAALATLTGIVAPVLLDRTLTVVSWGPLLALGYLVSTVAHRSRLFGAIAVVVLVAVMLPPALRVVTVPSTPDRVLRHVEHVTGPGDVIAMRPAGRVHELVWSVGVRGRLPYRTISLAGLGNAAGIVLGPPAARSGRLWLLDWTSRPLRIPSLPRCAPDWSHGGARLYCLLAVP
jgi:Dolichyl-phosphate-mannose-protein mannosyltransferase